MNNIKDNLVDKYLPGSNNTSHKSLVSLINKMLLKNFKIKLSKPV